jgi:hypothetical protein
MNNATTPPGFVLEAVQEKLLRVEAECTDAEQIEEHARLAYFQAQAKAEAARARRASLRDFLNAAGAPLASPLPIEAATREAHPQVGTGTRSRAVPSTVLLEQIGSLLADGSRMKTREIQEALTQRGIHVKTTRISQLLSLAEGFEPDRLDGWYSVNSPKSGPSTASDNPQLKEEA